MIAENYFFGPILFKIKIEDVDLEKVKLLLHQDENKNMRKDLAGAFKTEYKLDNVDFQNVMEKYYEAFRHGYYQFYGEGCQKLKTKSVWVNYMRKGDFNPPHVHRGCDLASVLFIKSPNELKNELKEYYSYAFSSGGNGPGCLCFFYGADTSDNQVLKSFEPSAGDFFVFPHWLQHWVNPFKCEGERITVAANLIYNKTI
jgi:hypothetical protein